MLWWFCLVSVSCLFFHLPSPPRVATPVPFFYFQLCMIFCSVSTGTRCRCPSRPSPALEDDYSPETSRVRGSDPKAARSTPDLESGSQDTERGPLFIYTAMFEVYRCVLSCKAIKGFILRQLLRITTYSINVISTCSKWWSLVFLIFPPSPSLFSSLFSFFSTFLPPPSLQTFSEVGVDGLQLN